MREGLNGAGRLGDAAKEPYPVSPAPCAYIL